MNPLWRLTPAASSHGERVGRIESRWYELDGRKLHARVSVEPVPADAPVVVLVHGLAVSSAYLVPTAVRLAPICHVYAPDLPGFGRSEKPDHVLSIAELADTLIAWMDDAEIVAAVMIGNSMGCQIIAEAAKRYPDRVLAAVLQGPTIDGRARTLRQQVWRVALDIFREHRTQPFVQAIDYAKCGPRRAYRTFRHSVDHRIEDVLPDVPRPVIVVQGERDPIVPLRWAREVAGRAPQGQLFVVPGGPHTVNYSKPADLVRIIVEHAFPAPSETGEA